MQVLGEFEGVFGVVVFAILEDKNSVRADSRAGNVAPFVAEFATAAISVKELEARLVSLAVRKPTEC